MIHRELWHREAFPVSPPKSTVSPLTHQDMVNIRNILNKALPEAKLKTSRTYPRGRPTTYELDYDIDPKGIDVEGLREGLLSRGYLLHTLKTGKAWMRVGISIHPEEHLQVTGNLYHVLPQEVWAELSTNKDPLTPSLGRATLGKPLYLFDTAKQAEFFIMTSDAESDVWVLLEIDPSKVEGLQVRHDMEYEDEGPLYTFQSIPYRNLKPLRMIWDE